MLEAMKIGQLDQNLRRFYAKARTKKGEDYSKSTLLGFRHSIERFLNAHHLAEAYKFQLTQDLQDQTSC